MSDKKDIFDFGSEDRPPETEPETIVEPSTFISELLTARNLSIFNPCDLHGSLKILKFMVEADTNYIAGSQFSLCKLPPSMVRILGALSYIEIQLSGETATLGWSKYRTRGRETIGVDFKGFGFIDNCKEPYAFLQDDPLQSRVIDSLEGVGLICTAGDDGKKGDYIEGYIIYVKQ